MISSLSVTRTIPLKVKFLKLQIRLLNHESYISLQRSFFRNCNQMVLCPSYNIPHNESSNLISKWKTVIGQKKLLPVENRAPTSDVTPHYTTEDLHSRNGAGFLRGRRKNGSFRTKWEDVLCSSTDLFHCTNESTSISQSFFEREAERLIWDMSPGKADGSWFLSSTLRKYKKWWYQSCHVMWNKASPSDFDESDTVIIAG